ncbi:MAG TPA: dihydrolipoamide acetyltransferase family protein [Acidimicrobiales bacterium]|nr:dihydrolipoamide acetyltransferase family protein [Acidimicrobiales bacterium]
MTDILMPQLGETVTEGTITKWIKSVGEEVAIDEALFEVSTDKVDSEVPSAASGILTEILVPEGETVPVGARLAVISDGAGATAPSVSAVPSEVEVAPPVQQAEQPIPAPQETAPAPQVPAPQVPAPQVPAPQVPAPQVPAPTAVVGDVSNRTGLLLSPVVRRLIVENSLDPAQITGTGPGGRITRQDVLAVIDGKALLQGHQSTQIPVELSPVTQSPATRTPAAAPSLVARSDSLNQAQPALLAVQGARSGDEVVPFNNIRRRTAEHMVRSKATSAHTLVVTEVDYESIDRVRSQFGPVFKQEEGFSLTYLPFVIVAAVEAIRAWPHVNASVGDDAVIVHHDIHVGIAVDLESEGLIVPVIHYADTKRLRGLAREVRELATKARTKKLTADDIAGGTFTITNPGPFGTLITAPIINQPQVAILSSDGVKRRPVVVELADGTEAVAIHSVGNLALSFDHRVVDGALAARFLQEMKSVIEGRDWVQEL